MASRTLEQYHRDVITGSESGTVAAVFRASLRAAESVYALATRARNAMFNSGMRAMVRVPRPVISVGNITTGGTGKTPVVAWLVQRLGGVGFRSAILLRGYKGGDEQRMLRSQLPMTVIEPDPDRVEAAFRVLNENPGVNLFVLDDGFQHRRIHRDVDIVLIDASNPFGFDHVLPRGLLREPLAGLARANALVITHCEAVAEENVDRIDAALRRFSPSAPIFRCRHVHSGFAGAEVPGRRAVLFCGIGNPAAFQQQMESAGVMCAAAHWFDDHHEYTIDDLRMLRDMARQTRAELLITTEKDWVKLHQIAAQVPDLHPIARAQLAIEFSDSGETELVELARQAILSSRAASSPASAIHGS